MVANSPTIGVGSTTAATTAAAITAATSESETETVLTGSANEQQGSGVLAAAFGSLFCLSLVALIVGTVIFVMWARWSSSKNRGERRYDIPLSRLVNMGEISRNILVFLVYERGLFTVYVEQIKISNSVSKVLQPLLPLQPSSSFQQYQQV